MADVPVIDISALASHEPDTPGFEAVARRIDTACRSAGFFAIEGHGIPAELSDDLERFARKFFDQPDEAKAAIAMREGGRAWRGWFPVGGELTSGVPDRKEGLYVGRDIPGDDPRVVAGTPLHGPNLFPAEPAELGPTITAWMDACEVVGQRVLSAMAVGLGLAPDTFAADLTADPTVLFRIFHYPPEGPGEWGVAEHTDYGILTLLLQDDSGGLEVHAPDGWVEIPPRPGTIVCNIGDMLERLTGGRYRSTPHRVVPPTRPDGRGRLSYPFFLDPGWDTEATPLPLDDETAGPPPAADRQRWDGEDPLAFEGVYGDYLTSRVARVFPDLFAEIGE